ncbi:MAG TPA: serine/threonine-protein kinase [Gemmata sp.]|jgi:serine/threonine protein kinase|nr:serine/threonine-protein kinase [Gemmata sp.]
MSSLLAANTVDAAALADELARFRVIEPKRLTDLLSDFSGGGAVALAEYLVHRGVLTTFQADRALAGESRAIVLGPYRLTDLAGVGAFGPVFAANRRDKPGEFRLRVFPLRSLWKAREAKQIARSLAIAQHPAVIALLDADSANGFHYLVWPHVEGEPLTERVELSGPLAPRETIGLLAHLADALHTYHMRKIVHGALTPRSIVLDRNGLPRLLEFGAGAILAANLADEESLLDTLSGSIAATEILKFAAPEFVADPSGTPATDQYALGAIGYFALTGEPPFATASLTDWLAAKVTDRPYPLSDVNSAISTDLARIIDRMLRPNSEDRFFGLDEVQDQLAGIAGGVGLVAEPSPTADAASPGCLPLFTHRDPSRSGGSVSWSTAPSGIADLPTRDDSDASITFELPPPIPESVPPIKGRLDNAILPNEVVAAPSSRPMDMPSLGVHETEPTRYQEYPRNTHEAGFLLREMEVPIYSSPLHDESKIDATSPAARMSPAQSEDLHMSKPVWPDPFAGSNGSTMPPKTRTTADPRKGLYTPVHYHTETADEVAEIASPGQIATSSDDRPVTDSVLWKKVKRNLLFWQKPMDVLRVSVFGPASVAPGQSAKVSVFLHTPEATDSVRTLSRAFHHDSELIGSGYVAQEVTRETTLGVHLSVANAGVSKSLLTLIWRGQPHRLVFDLHVPWESPSGPAPGLVSIGRDNVRIGKIEFRLTLLPRKG